MQGNMQNKIWGYADKQGKQTAWEIFRQFIRERQLNVEANDL